MGARELQDQTPHTELESFFWLSADLMAVLDESLCVLRCNPAFERLLGTRVMGRSMLEVCAPTDREKVREALERCLRGSHCVIDAAVVRPSQSVRHGEWTASAEQGRVYVIIRDLTAKRRLEQELAHARKLEAVGQLASGIAHELNTPIQFVGDNLTFIGESLRDVFVLLQGLETNPAGQALLAQHHAVDLPFVMKELPGAVEQACEGVQRVAELVRGMKEFAHQDGGEVTPTDLARSLERTITISRNEWKYVAEVVTDFDPAVPPVPCQASAMRQVFLNLICNAAHAIADQNQKLGRERGRIEVKLRVEGDCAVVSVSDDGCGMTAAVKARLFEPFFTTKPVGRGTGQGLAISRTIVSQKHGGRLDCESQEGVGTTFHVRLPLRLSEGGPE